MDRAETEHLRQKINNLSCLKSQLDQQDAILRDVKKRSQSWEGASDPMMDVLARLFGELSQTLPEKTILFDRRNNNLDALRANIVSARSKVEAAITDISELLDHKPLDMNILESRQSRNPEISEAADKRLVFVVHGRNMNVRNAMFSFLRSIDLYPIEWEEAIHLTSEGSPHNRDIIDIAFSKAQAAVILITGDDLACLGEQFVQSNDPDYEKRLSPQARPNVIFEMGMAFGKYPSRTIIAQFGVIRPFTDIAGLNTIAFHDDPESRKKLADRLKTSGCLVRTDNRSDWMREGNFSSAFEAPRHPAIAPANLAVATLEAEIKKKNEEIASLRQALDQRKAEVLHTDLQQVGIPAVSAPTHSKLSDGQSVILESGDGFTVNISQCERGDTKGFILILDNNRLTTIGQFRVRVLKGQSFDSRHEDWRESHLNPFVGTNRNPIRASCTGQDMWLLRKIESSNQLQIGNENGHPLEWPVNDKSLVQTWLLAVEITAEGTAKSGLTAPQQLVPIKQDLVVEWDTANDRLSIGFPPFAP